ncbi:hypothetical protein LSTR_LSTR009135 [Laodelphax striatellus]|uniref:Peptidase M16 N-terminal domain-containing protein n=1 Tax=Laodelphax striatellus TaxID=195883 RepID=A0A482XNV5_LAOST|nr:hypothetical protein LSTR_LSTR009135 [Laodelphax striatellus]
MDVLDAENEMIPIDVLRCSNFSYETPPVKPSLDKKEYSVLKLTNGLTALLISDGRTSLENEEEEEEDESEETVENDDDDYYYYGSGLGNDDDDEESESFSESYVDSVESYSRSESSIGVSVLEDDSSYDRLAMSACAVCVDVGSFNDPEEMPGLAHLLEHVVGAGSRTYPSEVKFGEMLNEFGGSFYSSTRGECTTYYFDCLEDNIQFFLERFSKQLISPILDHDTIEEEIANIKFEFQTDVWFNNHVNRKLLMYSTADETNPAHKLAKGNRIIDDNVSKETLLKLLCEFWKKNYSAHRITLAIQSRHSLKTLEMWVEEYFLNIPCNNLPAEVFPACETPFKAEEFCKLFTVEPIENENLLQISWMLPSIVKLYKSKPLHYIRCLVVQECTGSLVAYLRKKNWASEVTCNDHRSSVDFNSIYSIFSIKIHLTNMGVNNMEETCRVVFTFIKFLQESIPVKWIFNEIKTVADILFAHSTDQWPLLNVKNLAENMRLYPSIDYIQGEHLFSEYDPDVILQLLTSMKPNNANIIITSLNKSEKIVLENVEPWLGKRYSKSNYTTEFEEDLTAKQYFCLPNANPFIANDFSILPSPEEDKIIPEVISKSDKLEVWYKLETKFQRPEGCLRLKFASPEVNKSVKSYVMFELLLLALDRVVRQEIHPALTSGFDYSLNIDENGFVIFLYGFNEKLGLLLESVMKCVKKSESISDLISDEEYDEFLETAISKSDLERKPFKLCYELIQKIIFTPIWSYFDKLSVDITDEQLLKIHLDTFAKKFLETSSLKCFIHGNISREQAMVMINIITNSNELPSDVLKHKSRIRVCDLPIGELYCKVQSFDSKNPHHYLINYFQCGICETKEQCKLRLIVFLLKEYLSKKHSKEQMIFNVFAYPFEKYQKIMGILVAVKSKEDSHLIDVNASEFLQKFSHDLEQIPVSIFEQLKATFIKTVQQETKDLVEETNKLWNEINNHVPVFDRQKKEIEETKKLNIQEIRETFKKTIDSKSKRKLSVEVEAFRKSSKSDSLVMPRLETSGKPKLLFIDSKTNEKKTIKNIEELKSSQILFPISD